jgi:hypothetical protein
MARAAFLHDIGKMAIPGRTSTAMVADFTARFISDFPCLVPALDDMASRANLSFLDDALRRLVCCCRRNIQVVRVGGVRG